MSAADVVNHAAQTATQAMTEPADTENDRSPPEGLAASAGSLIRHAIGLLNARLSLAVIELGEARDAFLTVFVLAVLALLMVSFTFIALSALIVVLLWDALGWRVLLLLAVLYTLFAWLCWRAAQGVIREGRLGLPLTIAELRQDRDALFRKDEE